MAGWVESLRLAEFDNVVEVLALAPGGALSALTVGRAVWPGAENVLAVNSRTVCGDARLTLPTLISPINPTTVAHGALRRSRSVYDGIRKLRAARFSTRLFNLALPSCWH